ncbi:glycosyltransferase family 1 protein [Candidatus Parcubacteria bacterium]|nr:MAG: glycosyltransferase family 1 protein [Candidatus Parcubacteria bacterium]
MPYNLLFLDHTPFVGGAQLSLLQHLRALDRSRFKVIAGISRKAELLGLADRYRAVGADICCLHYPFLRRPSWQALKLLAEDWRVLGNILKERKIDLVVTNSVRAALVGTIPARWAGAKVVWLVRDFTFPRWLFACLSPLAAQIVFNSWAVRRHYICSGAKARVVYVGRDFYRLVARITQKQKEQWRARWRLKPNAVAIGYAGRLVKEKGVDDLIKALAILRDKTPLPFACLIAGTGRGQRGGNEQELRSLITKLKLEQIVKMVGFQKDLVPLFSVLDILALPSHSESFSSAVIDAMMAGVAVVATNQGGTPELVKDGKTGILVPVKSPPSLAQALCRLIENPHWRRQLAEAGRRQAMQQCRIGKTTRQLEEIYLKTLSV